MKYSHSYQRSFLKWAGSKYKILPQIIPYLSKYKQLNNFVEPFVGSGSVFINTHNYKKYILSDTNKDLINLYIILKKYGENFIQKTAYYFQDKFNNANAYYDLREDFNDSKYNSMHKSSLFIYLNRHGYNGLCRYNSHGKYNVPFGNHTYIKLPTQSMYNFHLKLQFANIKQQSYTDLLQNISEKCLIYCDPPYVDLNNNDKKIKQQKCFNNYYINKFNSFDQKNLVKLCQNLQQKNCIILISNHDTNFTQELYKNATKIHHFYVKRNISCKADNRNYVKELLAIYT